MRSIASVFLIGILLSLMAGCGKHNSPDTTSGIITRLRGEWQLRFTRISWQRDSTYHDPGNTLSFTATGWTRIQGSLALSGSYTVSKDPLYRAGQCDEVNPGEFNWKIVGVHGNDTLLYRHLQLAGDTLKLRSGCFQVDGGTYEEYLRLPK